MFKEAEPLLPVDDKGQLLARLLEISIRTDEKLSKMSSDMDQRSELFNTKLDNHIKKFDAHVSFIEQVYNVLTYPFNAILGIALPLISSQEPPHALEDIL